MEELKMGVHLNGVTILPFILLSLALIFLSIKIFAPKSNQDLPPAPPGLPIIGHLHLLSKFIYRDLDRISKRYGPVVLLRMGAHSTLVVSSPEMAKEFLMRNDHNFPSRPSTLGSRELAYDQKSMIMASSGEYWKRMRRLLSLELLSSQKVEESREIRAAAISDMIKTIKIEGSEGKDINMSDMVNILNFNSIIMMMLGKDLQKEKALQIRNIITEGALLFGTLVPGDFIPLLWWIDIFQGYKSKMRKVHVKLDQFLGNILEEHRRQNTEAKKKQHSSNFIDAVTCHNLEDDEVKAIIQDVLAAGTESTSSNLQWALSELLLNPSILKKAQEEIDQTIGINGVLDESCINDLKYLKAIVKETLRLHPTVPLLLPHVSLEDCTVAGYYIPKGTRLLVNVWAIGRDPQVWERPLEFDPERFMESTIDVKGQDFSLLPFGSGKRICLGSVLAMRTMEITLAHLLHAFDWDLPRNGKLDMEVKGGQVLARANPLFAIASPRHR